MFYFTSIGIGMWHMENVQMDARMERENMQIGFVL